MPDDSKASIATKADLMAALSRLKKESIAWQLAVALALFCALKFIH